MQPQKAARKTFEQKDARKMLMKLTTVLSFPTYFNNLDINGMEQKEMRA